MYTEYMNRETGEVMGYWDMTKEFREKYEGEEPTDLKGMAEYFLELSSHYIEVG